MSKDRKADRVVNAPQWSTSPGGPGGKKQKTLRSGSRAEHTHRVTRRLLLITDRVPAMIWMTAPDGACTYVNSQWLNFTGRRLDQELGKGWIDRIHPDDRKPYVAAYKEAVGKRQGFTLEHRLQHADGGFRWMLNTGAPIFLGNGRFGGYVGACFDISERRATEQSFVELGGRLINAQEEERRRVAWELHEDLSQKMALLSTDIEQVAELASPATAEVSAGLRHTLSRVREVASDIHRLAYELHPSKLDRLGLAAAAKSLCKGVSKQQGMHVLCTAENIPDSLPRNVSLCLYRVIQESLQNVVKHSGAPNAAVELHGLPGEIRLRITDEGVGFDPESASRKGGLGLLSMRERLRLVGGTISIQALPSCGTRVDVRVPLAAAGANSTRGAAGSSGQGA